MNESSMIFNPFIKLSDLSLFLIKKRVLSPVVNLHAPVVYTVYKKGLKLYEKETPSETWKIYSKKL